jgi:asparagine N-glycosylation enzyme membrane subunit Stt3
MPVVFVLLIVFFFLFRSKINQLLKSKDLNLDISFIIPLSLIFSTISWNHHYIIMIFPLNFLFYRIISERRYNYLLPCLLLAFLILFHPRGGGFPFNQVLLFSTVLFLGLLYLYHFSRSSLSLREGKK